MSSDGRIDYYFWHMSDWAYFGHPRLEQIADALHLPRVMRVDGAVAMAEAVYATLDLRDETQRSPGDALVGMQP